MQRATGVDVSHWHPVSSWPSLMRAGISMFGAKATEGLGTDLTFQGHRDGARAQPLALCWWYHVAKGVEDPTAQAANLMRAVGELRPNERLVLDTERGSNAGISWIEAFFAALPAGRHMLYTSSGVWSLIGNPEWSRAADVDLILPRYGTSQEPIVPGPWLELGRTWTLWQNSQTATVPGVDGACDFSVFNGDAVELATYAGLSAPAVA